MFGAVIFLHVESEVNPVYIGYIEDTWPFYVSIPGNSGGQMLRVVRAITRVLINVIWNDW
jgi:hypothetical protein